MGGSNPYIEKSDIAIAQKPFKVTIITPESPIEIQVDPTQLPLGETGLAGSILDIALGNGIDVEHACGGVCACSTCHVIVKEGLETCNEPTDDENDQLDEAPGANASLMARKI
jgi:2Fe-2S ferredoxin